jgi:hypothetical protein
METDNKNLLKETETTIGLKALAYKKIFFDNKDYQIKPQYTIDKTVIDKTVIDKTVIDKTVIDKNKCKRNLLLVAALSVGYVLLANYDYNEVKKIIIN